MGPVAIESVKDSGSRKRRNRRREQRVFSRETGETTRDLLRGVVVSGTGTSADPGNGEFAAGKTGTTENYGDAWFVGFTNRYTIAVWVGYPDRTRYMKTEFNGEPVAGGTFPASIWRDFVLSADRLEQERNPKPEPAPTSPVPGTETAGDGTLNTSGDGTGEASNESDGDETPYDPDPTPYSDGSSSTPGTTESSPEADESSSETDSPSGY
jgi:penicillin-binding protein 1A